MFTQSRGTVIHCCCTTLTNIVPDFCRTVVAVEADQQLVQMAGNTVTIDLCLSSISAKYTCDFSETIAEK